MEGIGTQASAMAPYANQLPNQVPWRRSSDPATRTTNSETLIAVLLHRIMAKPELPALRQLRHFFRLLSPKGSLREMRNVCSLRGGVKHF